MEMSQEAVLLIQIIVLVATFVVMKFFPGAASTVQTGMDKAYSVITVISQYAECFVYWANQFQKDKTGSQKMDAVLEQLTKVANKYNIDVSTDELKAIAQTAYEAMMAAKSKNEVLITKVDNNTESIKTNADEKAIIAASIVKDNTGNDVAMLNDSTKVVKN